MSTRAYKVTQEIKFKNESTLNLFKDTIAADLLGFLYPDNGLDENGNGIIELKKENVESALQTLKDDWDAYLKDGYTKEDLLKAKGNIKKVLDDLGNNNYIQYKCF